MTDVYVYEAFAVTVWPSVALSSNVTEHVPGLSPVFAVSVQGDEPESVEPPLPPVQVFADVENAWLYGESVQPGSEGASVAVSPPLVVSGAVSPPLIDETAPPLTNETVPPLTNEMVAAVFVVPFVQVSVVFSWQVAVSAGVPRSAPSETYVAFSVWML
jgi:hypothetical protein